MSLEESELQELVAQSKESEKMNSIENEFQKRIAQREEQDREFTESMEKHPRVGLLPSPDKLTTDYSLGEDAIDSLKDFRQTYLWLRDKEALNTEFYKYYTSEEDLTKKQFEELIKLTFSKSFDAVRHTANPTRDEYVILYYAGHGLWPMDPNNTTESSMPKLEVELNEYFVAAKDFAKDLQDQPVKGGELLLHDVGCCGLYGLIQPFIASVIVQSQNNPEGKKNKHLIIILDSCYSGMIAQDLEGLKGKDGPWNRNGCSISIQTACGDDEPTFGGYFTPCFLTLNKEQDLLDDLKKNWEAMEDAKKDYFKSLSLPSPKVVTTRHDSAQNNPTMEFSFDSGHKLTLFSDPGFFKFCALSIFARDEVQNERVLNNWSVSEFMENTSNFTILDYKLKTLQRGPFAGSPLGLFLIEEPGEPEFAVCAHVHFAQGDTSRVGRINLVRHLKPPLNNVLYCEDHDGVTKRKVKEGNGKIKYAAVPKVSEPSDHNPDDWKYWKWKKGTCSRCILFTCCISDQSSLIEEVNKGAKLVNKCHDFVEDYEPRRWDDHTKWNMRSSDLSYRGKLRQKERFQWIDEHMKKNNQS